MGDKDTLRILLATDNHLGFGEKDGIRSEDSFITFEEILGIAKREKPDCILLAGDLFHENKPSRSAEKKCVDLLRKYVLGDEPILLELLSDPSVNFRHSNFQSVNFEDQNINVSLPIFSIHGNHDDPSGLGGFSILDTLHSTGLLNYFGVIENPNKIEIHPLLLRKGETKVALYGLSSMKDERLHRKFLKNEVSLLRPSFEASSWFNLFVLHQNRAKHGPTNYIPEYFLDSIINLAIWGHEHECRIEPETIVHGDKELYVIQPGSSIATSLCEGESRPKKVGILSIRKDTFKLESIPLETVRPLIFKTLTVSPETLRLPSKSSDKNISEMLEKYLSGYVEEMLIEADSLFTGHPKQPKLPLLRLRVEYFDEAFQLTPGRFGNLFHDRVANPSEILIFRRKILKIHSEGQDEFEKGFLAQTGLLDSNDLLIGSSMKDLIATYFEKNNSLQLLGLKGIGDAVESFIEKDAKDSLGSIVDKQLKQTYEYLLVSELENGIRMIEEEEENKEEMNLSEESLNAKENNESNLKTSSIRGRRGRGRGQRGQKSGTNQVSKRNTKGGSKKGSLFASEFSDSD